MPGKDKNWYGGCEQEILSGLSKCSFNINTLTNSLNWKVGSSPIIMKSDQVLHVPEIFDQKLKFNIKWTASVPIDVSAIMCDAEGTKVDSVYYKNKQSMNGGALQQRSIKNDSTYFELDLEKMPAEVSSIWFVSSIYRKSFEDV